MPMRPEHGGLKPEELRALGVKPEDVLDFSASISPIGPPESVWDAIQRVDLAAYPDPGCLVLRDAISKHLPLSRGRVVPLPVQQILVANGSTEIIHLLARAFLSPTPSGPAKSVFLLTPTYGEYLGACRLMGVEIISVDAADRPGFHWDLDLATRRIIEAGPGLTFLCNPNNPTGVYLGQGEVLQLADATAQVGGILVLDEAYLSFVEGAWDSLGLLGRPGVVLVRSMTKDYGLTALRLGYALASEEVINELAAFQPDWSVNGLAQAAGMAALADTAYLPKVKAAVAEAKDYLSDRLTRLGFLVPPSAANFLLVQVGEATAWRAKLMAQGLFVRDCSSFGLPEYIRVGIRSLPDCQRLAEAIAELARNAAP